MMCTYERNKPNKQKILPSFAFWRRVFYLCYVFFFGKAARGALQDFKRERPTSRFAAL